MLNPILLYKIGGAVILVALFSWKVYSMGQASTQADWDAEKVVQLAAVAVAKDKSQAISAAVDIKHVKDVEKIRTVFKTIVKEVPVYVDKIADSACIIPHGFVLVHDSAASGSVPAPPSGLDGTPSGVDLSTVAEVVAENYGTYQEIRQRLIDLQDWVAKQAGENH